MTNFPQIIEPSSAVVLAAVLSPKFSEYSKDINSIGLILSGGNLDLEQWDWKKAKQIA